MDERIINNWEGFKKVIQTDRKLFEENYKNLNTSPLLFRGQADSEWELKSTLNRNTNDYNKISVTSYYKLLKSIYPLVSGNLNCNFDIPENFDFGKLGRILAPPPGYEFMVYLRHHGFPSPLLDWTVSPYVAAFFAFNKLERNAKNVSIFCFKEYLNCGKTWTSEDPHIIGLGPYIKTHKRHYLQQAQYTISVQGMPGSEIYSDYDAGIFGHEQDRLIKYILPVSIRDEVLKDLDTMNINAYSLFQDEVSFMQTLAYRKL